MNLWKWFIGIWYKIKGFIRNINKKLLILFIGNFDKINKLFLFMDKLTFHYFKYYWYLLSKKIYFNIIDSCFIICIKEKIGKLTNFLHPLDIFSLYIDEKKDIGWPEWLKKTFGKKAFIINLKEILDVENIIYLGKKYPVFFENLLFILLVINDKGLPTVPSDRIDKRIWTYVGLKVKEIYDFLEWLLLRKIFEWLSILTKWDNLGMKIGIYNYFDYKYKFNCLLSNKKFKEINDYKILFDLLSSFYEWMINLDMEYNYDDYRAMERLKFLVKNNLLNWKYKDWYNNLRLLFSRLNSVLLNHSLLISKEALTHNKEERLIYKFIKEIGVVDYSEFRKRLRKYLAEKWSGGILKSLLYSDFITHPGIIQFSNKNFKDFKGFFILPRGFISYIWRRIRDDLTPGKFWRLIESYAYEYLNKWIINGKLDKSIYLVKNWLPLRSSKKNLGDVDLLIYNKKSGSLVVFEFKYVNVLISFKKKIKDLISKDWKLKKAISQIKKIHENVDIIEKKLNIKIDRNKIHYVIVNFGRSRWWNSIIRDFVEFSRMDINIFDDFIYIFMNMHEFEDFVYIAAKMWLDFFDILDWKSKASIWPPFFKFLFSEYSLESKILTDLPDFLSSFKYVSYTEDDVDIYLKFFKRKIGFKTPFEGL